MLLHLLHMILNHGLMLAATATVGVTSEAGPLVSGGEGAEGDNVEGDGGDGTPSGDESGGGGEDGEGGESQDDNKPQKVDETKVDWRTVPPEVKSHLQEIAKTNPKLANLLQNAVWTSNNFLKEFPQGLKEVKALKSSIEELGGLDQIREQSTIYKNLVEDQEALDGKARAGDASVLDTLMEVAGDGFSKLMPEALNRWGAQDKAGYSHHISKLIVGAMREGGLVSDLNLAFKMLKLNNPEATKEAVECLNRCAAWANGVNELAVKVPERPQVDPKIAEQQQSIDTERTKLFNEKFSNEFGGWRNRQIQEAITPLTNGKSLNEYQMRTLSDRIVSDIKEILTSDQDYMKNLNRLYAARDMVELQKFAKARTLKVLPEVAKKAYRSLFSVAGTTKKPAVKTGTVVKPGVTVQPVKGWTKVSPDKAPTPDQIDGKKTDFSMKFKKQAILKDGSKVYWGDKIPA